MGGEDLGGPIHAMHKHREAKGSRVWCYTSAEKQNSQGKMVVVLCKHRKAKETGKGDHWRLVKAGYGAA